MFRFLTDRVTILVILTILLIMSSFAKDYDFINNITQPENKALITHDQNPQHQTPDEEAEDQQPPITDPGLTNTTIELTAPAFLPVGETLQITATLTGNEAGQSCLLTWFINDEIVKDEWIITGTEIPGFTHNIEYTRTMDETIEIKASLRYTTLSNESHEIEAKKTIIIENHSLSYWAEKDAARVLGMVKSLYNGDFTLEWALENDYDDYDKEVYINANGYTSETEYLIWVNRCFQRANIFKGSGEAGEWELYDAFIISTGGWRDSTPRGVTTIPSRTTEGWVFPELGYRVEPVVRFWPARSSPYGSSFAFHSRPLDIQTREITDTRIGVPASSGCIRMYCDDVWWIYHNIPDHTTVVVY